MHAIIPATSCFCAELCTGEVFEANCGDDETIVMTSAVFGRMKLGRCVKRSLGFLGCRNDALAVMDDECSGKRSCRVIVSGRKLHRTDPGACEQELAGYAELAYSCLKGKLYDDVRKCMKHGCPIPSSNIIRTIVSEIKRPHHCF